MTRKRVIYSGQSLGKGMKLGFLVLLREGAEIAMENGKDLWVQKKFEVDKPVEKVLTFKPLEFLEGFLERHSSWMMAKPRRELEKTIQMLRIAEGKE